MTKLILAIRNFANSSNFVVRFYSVLLPTFQVQVLKWIGDSSLNPERAPWKYIYLVINDLTKKPRKSV